MMIYRPVAAITAARGTPSAGDRFLGLPARSQGRSWRAAKGRGRSSAERTTSVAEGRNPTVQNLTAIGQSEGLTHDDILDNITIAWLTNTALSVARLYWENWGKFGYFNAKGVSIPVAVSVFPDELYPAPRSWTEKAFPKLIHYNKLAKGGHFAAWEQPKLLSEEIRVGFRSLRN